MKTALLSSTYFGPIQWYQKLHRYDECLIECHDNFVKQTYRNRCVIPTTNGVQALSIPVTCPDGYQLTKTPMQDIRISDHGNWRHVHWNALCSAYGESPFFMYYEDDLRPFFEQKWTFLIDFNMAITEKMIELLDIQPSIRLTDSFVPLTPPLTLAQFPTSSTTSAMSSDRSIPVPIPNFLPVLTIKFTSKSTAFKPI